MSLEISTLPPPPSIPPTTLHMSGLLVDVYGLSSLDPSTTHVSCLWLHHPRTRNKGYMADIAARCIGAWNERDNTKGRGLVALAFDQRNHGGRLVEEKANGAWREGNARHAVDMFGGVRGMVVDQGLLLDLVEGYLFPDGAIKIDQHLALGVSLGGHSVWQLMFADPRVTAGVVIVGCPDYMNLLTDRARLSKLATYSTADSGASFLGSADFPPSLVASCANFDPKGIFFGPAAVPTGHAAPDAAVRHVFRERLRGKKFLLCSGGDDKLVPPRCGEAFVGWFKKAAGEWFREERVEVDERVYAGVGHAFSAEMVVDAVRFVVEVVGGAENAGGEEGRAKI
ncbi:hypothetical protein C8A05DRAFT_33184 [Staphylotrichum tortipilum]|uniref:Alpha/Beta hydrolase protein n=1 Tax=Staphylotrichum tortipilum TaxID=2831512 RepID=A0AAN6MMQ9_9PEZI|nr:hypothetical protein C8A05DRAFT_33184 [Staphylotrichum longicolle]